VCACNTSHIVSFSFNKFKIFFSEEHFLSFDRLLFIYSFIIYNLIYSFENLKKCGKNLEKIAFERVPFQPLELSARSRLLLTTHSYELYNMHMKTLNTMISQQV